MFFFLLFFSFVFLITDLYENKSCVNCLYRYGSVSPAPTEPAPLRTADLERHTNAMEWEKLKKSCTHEDFQGIIDKQRNL
jgi:hypothetical protein